MSYQSWRAEPLTDQHDLSGFSCGKLALDEWLRSSAQRATRQNTARTYVWADTDQSVLAYYAVAPTTVGKEGLPRSASGGVSVIPAYLLARLALDKSLHQQGLGTFLLLDAIETICAASQIGAGRLIVVDALDDPALSFYLAHGFRRLADTMRAYLPITVAQRLLGESL